jgi:hypothetical protein
VRANPSKTRSGFRQGIAKEKTAATSRGGLSNN